MSVCMCVCVCMYRMKFSADFVKIFVSSLFALKNLSSVLFLLQKIISLQLFHELPVFILIIYVIVFVRLFYAFVFTLSSQYLLLVFFLEMHNLITLVICIHHHRQHIILTTIIVITILSSSFMIITTICTKANYVCFIGQSVSSNNQI